MPDDLVTTALKPCPFCGGVAHLFEMPDLLAEAADAIEAAQARIADLEHIIHFLVAEGAAAAAHYAERVQDLMVVKEGER